MLEFRSLGMINLLVYAPEKLIWISCVDFKLLVSDTYSLIELSPHLSTSLGVAYSEVSSIVKSRAGPYSYIS